MERGASTAATGWGDEGHNGHARIRTPLTVETGTINTSLMSRHNQLALKPC